MKRSELDAGIPENNAFEHGRTSLPTSAILRLAFVSHPALHADVEWIWIATRMGPVQAHDGSNSFSSTIQAYVCAICMLISTAMHTIPIVKHFARFETVGQAVTNCCASIHTSGVVKESRNDQAVTA